MIFHTRVLDHKDQDDLLGLEMKVKKINGVLNKKLIEF